MYCTTWRENARYNIVYTLVSSGATPMIILAELLDIIITASANVRSLRDGFNLSSVTFNN